MNGILILAHGSKKIETERVLDSLAEKVKAKTGENLVITAYLRFSEQNLQKGIDSLIEQGANAIFIIPLFIFDGVNTTIGILNQLTKLQTKYPFVQMKVGRHIGDDDILVELMLDRINSV